MSAKSVSADKWKLRPFDSKCRTFVDPVSVVEGQIRCKVPLWTGDFEEVVPELTAQGLRLDELPGLTVHRIGQYAIRAAQGGSLQCGPVGTVAHAIVMPQLPSEAKLDEDEHARISRRLSRNSRRLLRYMLEHKVCARGEKQTTQFMADALRLSIDDIRPIRQELCRQTKVLHESARGCDGGWWLTPDGERVAEYCRLPTPSSPGIKEPFAIRMVGQ